MLEAMRQLALDCLWVESDGGKSPDSEAWYKLFREGQYARLLPKLVEDVEQERGKDKQRYYTLPDDPQIAEVAVLEVHKFRDGDAEKLP